MAFPSTIPSYSGFTSGHTLQQDTHAAQHNSEQADVIALATKLGTGSSTSTNNTVLRGNGSGTSAWGQVQATSDITGILPTSLGGTGTTSTTGTGNVVFATSPTITTPTITVPTIADFTNANHNHQNVTGGGTLNAANAIQAGTIQPNNLVSSSGTTWAPQSFTPSWTNFTPGTSTVTAWYSQVGKMVWISLFIKMASGFSVGTDPKFAVPVSASSTFYTNGDNFVTGYGYMSAGGFAALAAPFFNGDATAIHLGHFSASSTNNNLAASSGTSPGTWAIGDIVHMTCFYIAS